MKIRFFLLLTLLLGVILGGFSATSWAKALNTPFPAHHKSPSLREREGKIVSIAKHGPRKVSICLQFGGKSLKEESKWVNCGAIKIYTLRPSGDRVQKVKTSCKELKKGLLIRAIFLGSQLKELYILPGSEINDKGFGGPRLP